MKEGGRRVAFPTRQEAKGLLPPRLTHRSSADVRAQLTKPQRTGRDGAAVPEGRATPGGRDSLSFCRTAPYPPCPRTPKGPLAPPPPPPLPLPSPPVSSPHPPSLPWQEREEAGDGSIARTELGTGPPPLRCVVPACAHLRGCPPRRCQGPLPYFYSVALENILAAASLCKGKISEGRNGENPRSLHPQFSPSSPLRGGRWLSLNFCHNFVNFGSVKILKFNRTENRRHTL